jgi:hypothetical protein
MEKWKFLTLPGLVFRHFGSPTCSQSLYRLHFCGSLVKNIYVQKVRLFFKSCPHYSVYAVGPVSYSLPIKICVKNTCNTVPHCTDTAYSSSWISSYLPIARKNSVKKVHSYFMQIHALLSSLFTFYLRWQVPSTNSERHLVGAGPLHSCIRYIQRKVHVLACFEANLNQRSMCLNCTQHEAP